jgi:cyclase
MIRRTLFSAIAIAAVLPLGAALAHAPAERPYGVSAYQPDQKLYPLGNGAYQLTGAHAGNTAVVVGSDGIIVVDSQFLNYYDDIKAKIASVSKLPVKHVIITHYHLDHVGANEAFRKDGALVWSHEEVVSTLRNMPPGANGKPRASAPEAALPNRTYTGKGMTLKIKGVTAKLEHLPGHTRGDTVVFFPAKNLIVTGDFFGSNNYPYVDVNDGGSIDEMIETADYLIRRSDDKTVFVPGHGPPSNKAGLIEYRNMMQTARDRVAKARAQGMTEDQVVDAKLLADLDHRWTGIRDASTTRIFPRMIYRSLVQIEARLQHPKR